jgi:hypothetical protein
MDQIVDAQTCRCDVLVITRVPSPLVCYLARRGLTSKKDQRFKAISKERADNNTGGPALLSCSETRTITKAHPLETFSSISDFGDPPFKRKDRVQRLADQLHNHPACSERRITFRKTCIEAV